MATVYRKRVPAACEAACALRKEILDALEQRGWVQDEEDRFAFWMTLEEALANAVKHGCHGDASRSVEVELEEMDDRVRIIVRDFGPGFDPDQVTMPDCRRVDGRGVCLIRHYMDRLVYDREQGGLVMERLRRQPRETSRDRGNTP